MFNAGVRPALNIGISVSRVGGNAQIKAMKKVAGSLKLDLAMHRELESFAKFGSDLDASTKQKLVRGEKLTEVIKQKQFNPVPVEKQVVLLFAAINGYLDDIPTNLISKYEKELFEYFDAEKNILNNLSKHKQLTNESSMELNEAIKEFTKQFVSSL